MLWNLLHVPPLWHNIDHRSHNDWYILSSLMNVCFRIPFYSATCAYIWQHEWQCSSLPHALKSPPKVTFTETTVLVNNQVKLIVGNGVSCSIRCKGIYGQTKQIFGLASLMESWARNWTHRAYLSLSCLTTQVQKLVYNEVSQHQARMSDPKDTLDITSKKIKKRRHSNSTQNVIPGTQ